MRFCARFTTGIQSEPAQVVTQKIETLKEIYESHKHPYQGPTSALGALAQTSGEALDGFGESAIDAVKGFNALGMGAAQYTYDWFTGDVDALQKANDKIFYQIFDLCADPTLLVKNITDESSKGIQHVPKAMGKGVFDILTTVLGAGVVGKGGKLAKQETAGASSPLIHKKNMHPDLPEGHIEAPGAEWLPDKHKVLSNKGIATTETAHHSSLLPQRGRLREAHSKKPWKPGDLYPNLLPDRLQKELKSMESTGVTPITIGETGWENALIPYLNDYPQRKMIYVLTENGQLIVGPRAEQYIHLKHAALANGENVFTAGEVIFRQGNSGIEFCKLSPSSGHYKPAPQSIEDVRNILTSTGMKEVE